MKKGTGLGLMLCKDFIERNGGRIWVKKYQRCWNYFLFHAPIAKPESKNVDWLCEIICLFIFCFPYYFKNKKPVPCRIAKL